MIKKVRCIDSDDTMYLRAGQVYEVEKVHYDTSPGSYKLKDIVALYSTDRFEDYIPDEDIKDPILKKVRCIDDCAGAGFIKGEIYDVIREDHEFYFFDHSFGMFKHRFAEIKQGGEDHQYKSLPDGRHVLYFDDRQELYIDGQLIHTFKYSERDKLDLRSLIERCSDGLNRMYPGVITINEVLDTIDCGKGWSLVILDDRRAFIENSDKAPMVELINMRIPGE